MSIHKLPFFAKIVFILSLWIFLAAPIGGPGDPGGFGPTNPDAGGGIKMFRLPPSPTQKFGSSAGLVGKILSDVLPIILGLAGFITVIVIIISGIQFVLSSGNPEAAAAAKNRLVYALVGFIIIVLAFAVLQIVNRIFLGNTGIV